MQKPSKRICSCLESEIYNDLQVRKLESRVVVSWTLPCGLESETNTYIGKYIINSKLESGPILKPSLWPWKRDEQTHTSGNIRHSRQRDSDTMQKVSNRTVTLFRHSQRLSNYRNSCLGKYWKLKLKNNHKQDRSSKPNLKYQTREIQNLNRINRLQSIRKRSLDHLNTTQVFGILWETIQLPSLRSRKVWRI